jgi:formylglycine-generating enzyme required for sulfatase activity
MNSGKLNHLAAVLVWTLLCGSGCDRSGTPDPAVPPSAPSAIPAAARVAPLTNMVPIQAGSFARFQQTITISRDFWLGKYEVTQAEYGALMGGNPSQFTSQSNAPVEKVTWNEAMAFCAALTRRERQAGRLPAGYEYRLPSEAEWEFACRAGTTNLFSFGDQSAAAEDYAWTWENSESVTHPVGLKRPNPWGLYDMHGNVWEWCLDWFADYPAADLTDPLGPPVGKVKVFRGGGWNNEVQFARAGNRFMMAPDRGIKFVGFRVALAPVSRNQAAAPAP